jgi:Uncharacterised ACR (DUF711)
MPWSVAGTRCSLTAMLMTRIALPACLLASFCLVQAAAADTGAPASGPQTPSAAAALRPKVRAITGFVRLDPAHYVEQVDAALAVLHDAQTEFHSRGYEVETIRLVTQPLAELVQGQTEAQALAFLGKLDALSAQDGFMPDIGPAMLRDSDDPRSVRLLERALSTLTHLNGNAILADEEGIHWRVVHESAALIHYLSEHSLHSQGNFNFTATAMLKPYGPRWRKKWECASLPRTAGLTRGWIRRPRRSAMRPSAPRWRPTAAPGSARAGR